MTLKGVICMAFAGVVFVYFLVFLLLAGIAERYIPEKVWDKLDRLLRFSKEVREDESD